MFSLWTTKRQLFTMPITSARVAFYFLCVSVSVVKNVKNIEGPSLAVIKYRHKSLRDVGQYWCTTRLPSVQVFQEKGREPEISKLGWQSSNTRFERDYFVQNPMCGFFYLFEIAPVSQSSALTPCIKHVKEYTSKLHFFGKEHFYTPCVFLNYLPLKTTTPFFNYHSLFSHAQPLYQNIDFKTVSQWLVNVEFILNRNPRLAFVKRLNFGEFL